MTRPFIRTAPILLATLTAFGCASGAARPDAARPPVLFGLPGVVDSVRHTPPLDRTHWGVGAYDPAADRMLLRVNVDQHFVPASNMKLVVTAVALGTLGPDFRYTTRVFAENARDGAASALLVAGAGDPTLSARFHGEPVAALRMIADSIAASGVRRVDGPLVIDASYFDAQRLHPTWEVGDLDWSYAPAVSAFAVDEGTVLVTVRPGGTAGEPGRVDVIGPTGIVQIENQLVTDTAFGRNSVGFVRDLRTDSFRFTGSVPLSAEPDTFRIPVGDPARYAGHLLRTLLADRGVAVGGEVVVLERTDARWNRELARFQPIASWTSPPLAEIVEAILEPSQNWIAEQLLKTLGAERGAAGTWSAGLEVERRYLTEVVGIDSAAFRLVDASGLSAQNLLTPDAIMRLLYHASQQPWGPIYRAAMAEPREQGSTLENRLITYEGRLFAKTGTITNVNSLSGYLVAADGREIIFSVLTNLSGVPAPVVRRGIDEIVEALLRVGTPPPPPPPDPRLRQ